MALYPGANVRLIDTQFLSGLALKMHYRVNLHTQAGKGSLFGFFNGPRKPSSHFWVSYAGKVEQYVDTAKRAEADLDGNDATISIETEGGGEEPWTPQQVQAITALVKWCMETHNIPKVLAVDAKVGSSSHGLSWHRLGVDGNFPALPSILAGRLQRGGGMHYSLARGKVCPGDRRIEQIPAVLQGVLGAPGPVTPPTPPQPVPAPPAPSWPILDVDGKWGPATTKRLQQVQGTPVDGVVSHQWKTGANSSVPSFQFDTTKIGSTVIKAVQADLGIGQDGLCGSGTISAMQRHYGTPVDGIISPISAMVKAMQSALNAGRF